MRTRVTVAMATALLASASATAQRRAAPRPDLADIVQGAYEGDVISDSRGSGRSHVTVTVTKTGPNTVTVTSDYPRLPPFTTRLAQYMQTIQNTGPGVSVFLFELSKNPRALDITNDDARWTGVPATR